MGFAGDHGTGHITNRQSEGILLAGLAESGQGVRGFAGLGDNDS